MKNKNIGLISLIVFSLFQTVVAQYAPPSFDGIDNDCDTYIESVDFDCGSSNYNWTRSTLGGGGGQLSLAVDPTNDSVAYLAGDLGGMFKTVDKGNSWFSIQNNLPNSWIASIRIDPLDNQVIYVTAILNSQTQSANSNGEIYRSRNGGQSWEIVYGKPGSSGENISFYNYYKVATPMNLVQPYDKNSPQKYDTNNNGLTDIIIVGGWAGRYVDTNPYNTSGIWKSNNEGLTFSKKALSNRNIYFVKNDPKDPETFYAGTAGDGLYKSTDVGDTWQKFIFTGTYSYLNNQRINDIGFNVPKILGGKSVIYLSVDEGSDNSQVGIYKSEDNGITWSHVFNNSNSAIPSFSGLTGGSKILVDKQDSSGNTVAVGLKVAYPLYMSTNGGVSWVRQVQLTEPSPPAPHWAANPWFGPIFAFDQGSNGTMYSGTGRGAIVFDRASNRWLTKSKGIGNIVIKDVEFDQSNSSIVHMAIADVGGPFITTNSGASWTYVDDFPVGLGTINPVSGKRSINRMGDIAISSTNPQLLYATGYANNKDGATVCKSTDGGYNWTAICNGLPLTIGNAYNILSIEMSPVDNNIVLLVTNESKIYRSTNGGDSWSFIRDITSHSSKIEFTNDGQTVVIGGHTNVYISNNAGLTWTSSTPSSGLAVYSVDVCRNDRNKLLAGVNIAGAFISNDQGVTWSRVFDKNDFTSLPEYNNLALSDYGKNIYSSTISAVQFDPQNCNTLYITHSANSVYTGLGLIRSEDSGNSWEIISDHTVLQTFKEFDLTDDLSRIVVGGLEMGFGTLSPPTEIKIKKQEGLKMSIYPNPSGKKNITVSYALAKVSTVDLYILDGAGNAVKTFLMKEQGTGEHKQVVDVAGYAPGLYFCKIIAGDKTNTLKFVVH